MTASPVEFLGLCGPSAQGTPWVTASPVGFLGLCGPPAQGTPWVRASPFEFLGLCGPPAQGTPWVTASPAEFLGLGGPSAQGTPWVTASPFEFLGLGGGSAQGTPWVTASPFEFLGLGGPALLCVLAPLRALGDRGRWQAHEKGPRKDAAAQSRTAPGRRVSMPAGRGGGVPVAACAAPLVVPGVNGGVPGDPPGGKVLDVGRWRLVNGATLARVHELPGGAQTSGRCAQAKPDPRSGSVGVPALLRALRALRGDPLGAVDADAA